MRVLVSAIGMFALMAFTSINKAIFIPQVGVLDLKPVSLIKVEPLVETVELEIETKYHNDFLEAIGFRESSNRYDIVNSYGYMGKYQFGMSTLKGLGIKVTKEEFLNDPTLQELAMQELLEHNRKKLRRQIDRYCGQTIRGVYITESGILAAAHLAGQGNVKRFFRKGYEFKDGYGTTMTSYMANFSGYQLDLN